MFPKPKLVQSSIKIFGYNSEHPHPVVGTFQAEISTPWNRHQLSTFHVIKGSSGSLLGKETAEKLDLLRVGPPHETTNTVITNIKTPASTQGIIDQHNGIFKGIGLLKNFELNCISTHQSRRSSNQSTEYHFTHGRTFEPVRSRTKSR